MRGLYEGILEIFLEGQACSKWKTEFGELSSSIRPSRAYANGLSISELRLEKLLYLRNWYRQHRDSQLEKSKAYQAAHRVEKKEYDEKRRAKLGESLLAKKRAYAKQNRSRETKRWQAWYARNKAKKSEYDRARRLAAKQRRAL
jgi:membrane-bound lytic murein transglycosylase B